MKIAIYAGMYKQNWDGATKTLYELTNLLLKNGNEVGIWAFDFTPQKRDGLYLNHIPSIPLAFYPEYKVSIPNPKTRLQLDAFEPDVIHITVPDFIGIYLMRYARRKGIPVLTSFHTDFPSYLKSYRLGAFHDISWRYLKWFYNQAQSVLAPTREVIEKLNRNGIRNLKVWGRGIHLNRFSRRYRSMALREQWGAKGKKVILYSGRFVWYKDLETFIKVYELFKANGPDDVVFVLVGDGPVDGELKRRMPEAHFPGYLEGEELSRVYASADILLFPSTTETFGNVVLEAMASGIPAVVSDIGGCKEVVWRSGGGMVCKAQQSRSFYEGCKRLVEDKNFYEKVQCSGMKYASEQSWDRINTLVLEEYKAIAGKRSKENELAPSSGPILVKNYH
jgi:phosphatidylinositol alpha 1,6-mannosyltransferase